MICSSTSLQTCTESQQQVSKSRQLGSPNAKSHLFKCYIFLGNYLPALTSLPYTGLWDKLTHIFTCLMYPIQPSEKQDKRKKGSPGAHQHRRKKNSFVGIQCFLTPGFQIRVPTLPRGLPQATKNVSNYSFCSAHFTFQSQMEGNLEQDFQKTERASSLYSQKKNNKSKISRSEVTWTTYLFCCVSLHKFSF